MDRRSFLQKLGLTALAVATADSVLDPEFALWTPGAKTFFLPPEKPAVKLPVLFKGDMITIPGIYAVNPITNLSTGYLQRFVVTEDVQSVDDDLRLSIAGRPDLLLAPRSQAHVLGFVDWTTGQMRGWDA